MSVRFDETGEQDVILELVVNFVISPLSQIFDRSQPKDSITLHGYSLSERQRWIHSDDSLCSKDLEACVAHISTPRPV